MVCRPVAGLPRHHLQVCTVGRPVRPLGFLFLQVFRLEPSKSESTSSCSRKLAIFLCWWHRKWTSPAIISIGLKCHEKHLENPAKVNPGAASFSTYSQSSQINPLLRFLGGVFVFWAVRILGFRGFYRFSGRNRQNAMARAVAAENFQSFYPGGIANGHHQLSFWCA